MDRLLVCAAALLALDATLRSWRPWRTHALPALAYLLLAWAPLSLLPWLGVPGAALLAGAVAVGGLLSFARMVGLTVHGRFFVPALLALPVLHALALRGKPALVGALPLMAVCAVLVPAVAREEPRAFLQKLCLAWVAVLVYGYLWSHAALLAADTGGTEVLVRVVLAAKAADVAWVAARRLGAAGPVHLPVATGAALLGMLLLEAVAPTGLALWQAALWGAAVGLGLAAGALAHALVVEDVCATREAHALKSSMLFGFAFSLALSFHLLRALR